MRTFRDCIHGSISLSDDERHLLESFPLRRLRGIRQMGFADIAFPSATHTRFSHSLGTLETASLVFDSIFRDRVSSVDFARFRAIIRIVALCHDVGHGPFSHSSEVAMPYSSALARQMRHEDYSIQMILKSELSDAIASIGKRYGFCPQEVADLLEMKTASQSSFFYAKSLASKREISFFPCLQQIISSEIDADRMDYLRRDSQCTGVSYGHFDFDWLVKHLSFVEIDDSALLSLSSRAIFAFEDFLLSRLHMFLMIYFHSSNIVYDTLLDEWVKEDPTKRSLPLDLNEYLKTSDITLSTELSDSKSMWAKRILEQKPFIKIMEWSSHLKPSMNLEPRQVFDTFDGNGISTLAVTSSSKISKYLDKKNHHPIYVTFSREEPIRKPRRLETCTDVFQKYKEQRDLVRLYVAPEDEKAARSLLEKLVKP